VVFLWWVDGEFVVKRGELDGGFSWLKNTPLFGNISVEKDEAAL
jgi:hypothetical protein